MTETEKKALTLLNEVCAEMDLVIVSSLEVDMPGERALLRAIEQHEAFKQEVSDAVEEWHSGHGDDERVYANLTRFIIAKPDPLVEAMQDAAVAAADALGLKLGAYTVEQEAADQLRAAIEARGGRIVWEG